MKRTAPGYAAGFRVSWDSSMGAIGRVRYSAPCVMGWAAEVRRRLIARGHRATIVRA